MMARLVGGSSRGKKSRDAAGSLMTLALAARGESLAAFDGRCIPGGCVAPPSNTGGILSRRALPAGRLARLGATPDFHHGLPGSSLKSQVSSLKAQPSLEN